MRIAIMLGSLFVVAVLAASASGAGAAKDPRTLVLQRSEFPAKTRLTAAAYPSVDKSLAAAGFKARSADYLAEIPRGKTGTLFVGGRVIVLASAAEASRLFAQFKRDLALDLKLARTVQLASFGDEQSAFFQTNGGSGARGDIRVRTGAVVWRVEIKWGGTEKRTRAQTLAELKTYAAKLERRVGRG
jgi:hypothetical protein